MKYSDVDEVLGRANASECGLGGSVWGTDIKAAAAVARKLQAGTVWVNTHMAVEPDVPFGGVKESGIGAQHGKAAIAGNTQARILRIPK